MNNQLYYINVVNNIDSIVYFYIYRYFMLFDIQIFRRIKNHCLIIYQSLTNNHTKRIKSMNYNRLYIPEIF